MKMFLGKNSYIGLYKTSSALFVHFYMGASQNRTKVSINCCENPLFTCLLQKKWGTLLRMSHSFHTVRPHPPRAPHSRARELAVGSWPARSGSTPASFPKDIFIDFSIIECLLKGPFTLHSKEFYKYHLHFIHALKT